MQPVRMLSPLLQVATADGVLYVAADRVIAIADILAGSDDDELGHAQQKSEDGYESRIDIDDGGEGWTLCSTDSTETLRGRYEALRKTG